MESIDLFEVLTRENSGMLTAYIRSAVSCASAADDIWQDTMLTAWRRWDDYDRSRPFGAWLRGIAAKNVMAWNRKHAKDVLHCDERTLTYLGDMIDMVTRFNGDTFDEKLDSLRSCIEALPDRYQQVIELRYEHDAMPRDIATRLDTPAETIKKQLSRARSRLMECMLRKLGDVAPLT